jgi:VanZ like family
MTDPREGTALHPYRDWSNRLLISALAGILFLTLYPFEFVAHAKGLGHASPLLLGSGLKYAGPWDVFLNILLFVPFGFALASKLRNRRKSSGVALLYTCLAGTLLSYSIEFVQIYTPARDSGWEDVVTNSIGTLVGCVASLLIAGWLFDVLSASENALLTRLTLRGATFILVLYFAVWFAASASLQKQTHLDDWVADTRLVIGNDATGGHPWKGQVSLLEIWNHAVTKDVVNALAHGGELSSGSTPTVKIEFPAAFNQPAGSIVNAIKSTSQFSIRVVLSPPQVQNQNGVIFSISHISGFPDLYFRQAESDLIFWFRNSVTLRRPALHWTVPNLLVPNRSRDILISYDGSELWFCVKGDGTEHDGMGPGTALASFVRHLKQTELNGYAYIYYALVFLPAGSLLGMIRAKQFGAQSKSSTPGFWALLLMAVVVAPAILECILVRLNARGFSLHAFGLSAAMVVLGTLWINADRPALATTAADERQ